MARLTTGLAIPSRSAARPPSLGPSVMKTTAPGPARPTSSRPRQATPDRDGTEQRQEALISLLRALLELTLFPQEASLPAKRLPISSVLLPLNPDGWSTFTLVHANQPLLAGTLDASGRALANLSVPPGLPLSVAGLTLNHAYILFNGIIQAVLASDAQPLALVLQGGADPGGPALARGSHSMSGPVGRASSYSPSRIAMALSAPSKSSRSSSSARKSPS